MAKACPGLGWCGDAKIWLVRMERGGGGLGLGKCAGRGGVAGRECRFGFFADGFGPVLFTPNAGKVGRGFLGGCRFCKKLISV